MKKIARIWP